MNNEVLLRYLECNSEVRERLLEGEIVEIASKLWAVCQKCECVVRVDKPIIGSTHICKE